MTDPIQLKVLQILQDHPNFSQRDLAKYAGVSLGKVNFVVKALKDKGLVKLENFSKNPNKFQYAYLLTPQGLLEKTRLTMYFLRRKQAEFEVLKQEIVELEKELSEKRDCDENDQRI
jgi:MarR family transcriptional regulator, temperature-dependent positive regulator of motility